MKKSSRIRSLGRAKHRGLSLPTVLVIAIFGALMVAVVFEMSSRFGLENMFFRRTYNDQGIASGYIEMAKGLLSSKILADEEAIHPLDSNTWNDGPYSVRTLGDIQIGLAGPRAPGTPVSAGDPLNVDETVNGRMVTMRVYDLTYETIHVPNDVSDQDRLLLPAPLGIVRLLEAGDAEWINVIDVEDDGINYDPNGDSLSLHLRDIGAYLIRVQIFDRAGGRLIRSTEEAFFILARDISQSSGSGGE